MHFYRHFGVVIAMLLLVPAACQSGRPRGEKKSSSAIRVLQALAELREPGRRNGTDGGTEYTIRVRIHTDRPLVFKSLYVEGQNRALSVRRAIGTVTAEPVHFGKGDSLWLQAFVPVSDGEPAVYPPPAAFRGAALLAYTLGGKARYHIIDTFVMAESLPRPQ